MNQVAALTTPRANAVERWLRFDRSIDVEAVYRRFVETAKFGRYLVAAFVGGVLVDGLLSVAFPHAEKNIVVPISMGAFYLIPLIAIKRLDGHLLMRMLRGRINLLRGVLFGVAAAVLVFACTAALLLLLERAGLQFLDKQTYIGGFPGWFILGIVLAPVVEEFAMQAWLQTQLLEWGIRFSIIATTVIFMALHGPSSVMEIVVYGGLLGIALMRAWSGSLAACISMHATNNALYLIMYVVYTFQTTGVQK